MCVCVCVCVYALRIVFLDKVLHTLIIIVYCYQYEVVLLSSGHCHCFFLMLPSTEIVTVLINLMVIVKSVVHDSFPLALADRSKAAMQDGSILILIILYAHTVTTYGLVC